jgi:hypothetical protein
MVSRDGDDPFHGADVYDDCDIPLAIRVVSDHLLSGVSLAANFVVASVEGGITRRGDARPQMPNKRSRRRNPQRQLPQATIAAIEGFSIPFFYPITISSSLSARAASAMNSS